MLVSAFAGSGIVTVSAPPPPWPFTLNAVATIDPFWGRFGGYAAIWGAIAADLAPLGINLVVNIVNEMELLDRVWGSGWNKSWADGGWDMTISEWYMQPHALAPSFESIVYGNSTPYEGGYNIAPWRNQDADLCLEVGMRSFDANTRKTYLWEWQEEFMHDPPWINLYYPEVYEGMGTYITGYDPSACWFYDTAHLDLVWMPNPLRDPNTAIYAVSEPYWAMNPMFMNTRTEEQASTLCFTTLYKWSCDPFPTDGSIPSWENYTIKPDMAADYPTYLNNNQTVRVTIRDGMVWSYSNGTTVPITADDVVWTYTTMMNPQAKATGSADFTHVIDNVTLVNATTVDFNLKYAYPDILSVLSNYWGTGAILPSHFLGGIPIGSLKSHTSNWDFANPADWMPVSGPFMLDPANPPLPNIDIILIKNPNYFGYNATLLGEPAWGPYNIDEFILSWIKNPVTRLAALTANDIDFGEYTVPAPVPGPFLRVVQYNRSASNPIWLNFNNEYLSNRYVRMAIAHAIDYNFIMTALLPAWGIATATRGMTPVLPQHYYTDEYDTTVQLFNTVLSPYTYDVLRATRYMNLWYNSYEPNPWLDGPVGDADFSGEVNMDDFYIWRDNRGTTSSDWTFLPGQDIDPDFDNNDYVTGLGDVNLDEIVDLTDLSLFSSAYGSTLGDPNYNPFCDFNYDYKVDVVDLFHLAKNYETPNTDYLLLLDNWGRTFP